MLGVVSPLLSAIPGVSHRFFQRVGGTSPSPWTGLNVSYDVSDAPARVTENLARCRFQLGVAKGAMFIAKQVHGTDVAVVDDHSDADAIAAVSADAVVTRAFARGVGVRTADCAPILLASDDGSCVAAVHAGWRGAVAGVIERAVDALGIDPTRIVAAVGPCIGTPRAIKIRNPDSHSGWPSSRHGIFCLLMAAPPRKPISRTKLSAFFSPSPQDTPWHTDGFRQHKMSNQASSTVPIQTFPRLHPRAIAGNANLEDRSVCDWPPQERDSPRR